MLSKFAQHVRQKRKEAARILNGNTQSPGSGNARSSPEPRAYGPIKCSVTDPQDGTSLHWDQGSLTKWQLERFVPQCDQLCVKCLRLADGLAQHLSQNKRPDGQRFSHNHHETLGKLRSAAIAGCHFCTLICSGGSHTRLNEHSDSTSYSLQIEIDNFDGYDVYIATDDEECSLNIWLQSGWYNRRTIPMTMRFPSTGDPKVLDLARLWLEGCMTTHDQCRLPTIPVHPVWSPKRLLQISASDSSVSNLRLVQSPNLLDSKGYLTLSHRWGGADVVKLTEDTINAFLVEIPLARLPRNFLDAILVTVHLGFKFLWIDSLCIIQDSQTDWQQESVNMGRIYRHAQCTIAAVEAQDSHGGLFRERNELVLTCCQLLGTQQGGHHMLWAERIDQPGPQPLYHRAWVLQEQCMSRRILEFGTTKISWKCISDAASEYSPHLRNREVHGGFSTHVRFNCQTERILTVLDDQELIGKYNAPSRYLYSGHWIQTWWDVIENYTERDLTYATDRAAAINGLISSISKARGVSVAYGMWTPYLLCDLLWRARVPAEGRVAIESPSWSWSSVDVGIRYDLPRVWKSEILDHAAATVAIDKTASLQRSGVPDQVLKVTAHMLEVHQSGPLSEGTPTGERYGFRLRDGRNRKQGWERPTDLEGDWDGEWCPDTTFDPNWNLKTVQFTENVHCKGPFKEDPWYRESMGLMVVPVDEEARVYSRVGWYSIEWKIEMGKHRYKTSYKRAKPWMKQQERFLGERQTVWLV